MNKKKIHKLYLQLYCYLCNKIIFPIYRAAVIVPQHRKAKKATQKYWDAIDFAVKNGSELDIRIAGANLNQALAKYFQKKKYPASSCKYDEVKEDIHQV